MEILPLKRKCSRISIFWPSNTSLTSILRSILAFRRLRRKHSISLFEINKVLLFKFRQPTSSQLRYQLISEIRTWSLPYIFLYEISSDSDGCSPPISSSQSHNRNNSGRRLHWNQRWNIFRNNNNFKPPLAWNSHYFVQFYRCLHADPQSHILETSSDYLGLEMHKSDLFVIIFYSNHEKYSELLSGERSQIILGKTLRKSSRDLHTKRLWTRFDSLQRNVKNSQQI